jgi:hypothetical protein
MPRDPLASDTMNNADFLLTLLRELSSLSLPIPVLSEDNAEQCNRDSLLSLARPMLPVRRQTVSNWLSNSPPRSVKPTAPRSSEVPLTSTQIDRFSPASRITPRKRPRVR